MVQIIHFFETRFRLYIILVYTFFKPYNSKIRNVSHYIYDLEFNWIQTLRFLYLIIHLQQKLKN